MIASTSDAIPAVMHYAGIADCTLVACNKVVYADQFLVGERVELVPAFLSERRVGPR